MNGACIETMKWTEEIPVAGNYDVIVAGGGVSGVAAALAAARAGSRVLLLEKQTWLGGLATTGLINYWVPLCNGRGHWIVRGMAREFFELSLRYGFDTLPESWKGEEPAGKTTDRCVSWFSSGLFSLSLLKLLKDEGVEILYDTLVSAPIMDRDDRDDKVNRDGKDNRDDRDDRDIDTSGPMAQRNANVCRGLIVDTKSGRRIYKAGMVIDATGDADILRRANMPVVQGKDYFTMIGEGVTLDGCRRALEKNNVFYAYYRPTGGEASLYGTGHPEGMHLFEGAETETINDFLQANQLCMLEKEKDGPRYGRNIHMLPSMAQLRTSCRLDGDSVLSGKDRYKHCETSIGAICDFENRDWLYEVPYGVLVRRGWNNILTCGRSASGSDWGWDVLRVIPPAILTGQAAGTAASIALQEHVPVSSVNISCLQQALEKTGVWIHFPDNLVPTQDTEH